VPLVEHVRRVRAAYEESVAAFAGRAPAKTGSAQ